MRVQAGARLRGGLIASATVALGVGAAHAQTEPEAAPHAIDSVVVQGYDVPTLSSPKQVQPILDTPQTVAVISDTLHEVRPVTRGARVASFFWVQSLVAEQHKPAILFDMDLAIQKLRGEVGDRNAALVVLTGAYHNLLRLRAAP